MTELPKEVNKAIDILEKNGHEAYIVGGCVRDMLIGCTISDYDITTSALPYEMKTAFENYELIETGLKHGTLSVVIDSLTIEITTYRVDSAYSDHRHPDSVNFTKSLREDISRRDFTINSMAYNEKNGLIDYFGGQADISLGIIRCVGEAEKRFNEDALRILRGLRFSSVLGFEIEENTKRAIFSNKQLLKEVSVERLATESIKLLCGKDAERIIVEYVDVLGEFLPELLPMKGFKQHNPHHIYNVLDHTAKAVAATPSSPPLRLAALFHDCGKPACFTIDQNGTGHFYGHAKVSAELAEKAMHRLRIDNDTLNLVLLLIKAHDEIIAESDTAVKRALNKYGEDVFFKLIELKRADNQAQNLEKYNEQAHYERLEKTARKLIAEKSCFSLKKLAVNGSDLISLGFKPGKELGKMLEEMLNKVIEGNLENDKKTLLEYAKKGLSHY